MKKLLLLSATALVAFSCGQKNKAHISGTFSGISKDTIYLEMLTTKGRTVVDSTVTNQQGNYRFTVSTPVAAPTFDTYVCMRISLRKREAMRTYAQTFAYVCSGLRVLT